MNNQGWPNERCEACGLRAKLNMGAGANAVGQARLLAAEPVIGRARGSVPTDVFDFAINFSIL